MRTMEKNVSKLTEEYENDVSRTTTWSDNAGEL